MDGKKKKLKLHLPHVYTIIFVLMAVFAVLTWVVPSGAFERTTVEAGGGTREVTVAGTYAPVDKTGVADGEAFDLRQGIFDVLMAPTRGIQDAIDVIAFIFLVGGAITVINKTGAIETGIGSIVKRLHNRDVLIIPITMLLFSIGGTVIGMSEETIPFFAIFVPIMIAAGFDSMTAFMIVFVGPQIGYTASTMNPFSVLIAEGVVGIQGNPQLWLRVIVWAILTGLAIAWVTRYAMRVKKHPELSITREEDRAHRDTSSDVLVDTVLSGRQKGVLVVFVLGIALIVWGLITQGWYMDEISGVFVAMGVLSGLIAGLTEGEIAEEFINGFADFAYAAIVVGMARAILIIAQDGMIIDTILNALAGALTGVPSIVYTSIMYATLSFLTILVPSSSGLASLTMPILGPLTELMGLNPEAAVTAVTMAESTMCFLIPTNAVLIAGLGICKISLGTWWKTVWKFFALVVAAGLVFTAVSGIIPV